MLRRFGISTLLGEVPLIGLHIEMESQIPIAFLEAIDAVIVDILLLVRLLSKTSAFRSRF